MRGGGTLCNIDSNSGWVTLEAGDISATGTPAGIGPIHPGDKIEASIEKIGILTNKVIMEDE